jgi:hypothetical protein
MSVARNMVICVNIWFGFQLMMFCSFGGSWNYYSLYLIPSTLSQSYSTSFGIVGICFMRYAVSNNVRLNRSYAAFTLELRS